MNKKLIGLIFLIFLGIILFSGCDSFDFNKTEDKYSYLVTYSDTEVNRVISGMDATYNELKSSVETASADTAETIKNGISTLEANLDRLDKELTDSVQDGRITLDVKKGYDTTIENLRTNVNKLNSDLESKGL